MCRARVIPIVIMVVMLVAKKILSRYFAIYHQLADTFLEKMQGMTTLKVYQNDSAAEQELAEESELFRQITMKVLTMQLLSTVVMDTVAYGGAACGIVIALNNALNNLRQGQVSRQGAIILILLAASYFLPMRQLGSYFHIGMNGMKASDQIFAFLDLPKKAAGQTSLPKKWP
ncbi:multidrug transporter [Lactobacillus delbrueckii]|uniref:multidrug transporter n=1 Tax=Lactobacillus delbrueckii TaxID=1584 RepID=UPI000731E644|nr:multidrug transporter [Lactobacillus delbrueckii]ALT48120.1 multidrug transporter [Lactobacillus delbrueckii subsp. bulgaricus]MCD5464250.1 multidrug transporter [Lactobacillus delbrueckii subsp. bulgaricus]MCD5474682.1 multidrug transporter [Lactobacillus delbrueckii subsp. bulgaricus]QIE62221.1 multidrug transporter [Lactobacillus delbrueckii subsp. bulgaricus]